jgi:hypothetical protein
MQNEKLSGNEINLMNVQTVRNGIRQKINYNCPYYPTLDEVTSVVTDQDTFPYPRYFRGKYNCSEPRVFEREAGFRTRNDNCYRINCSGAPVYKPNYCFSIPCSTVLPCKPEEQFISADKAEYDLIQRKNCITLYR